MEIEGYYLSSLDSRALESVPTCELKEIKYFSTGKECVIAEVTPPIPGHQCGLTVDVSEVVLACRHEGGDIFNRDSVTAADLRDLAWGELHRSRSDAENYAFDRLR